MMYGGHLPVVPGDGYRVPTRAGDSAAVGGIASPTYSIALLELPGFSSGHGASPSLAGKSVRAARVTTREILAAKSISQEVNLPRSRTAQPLGDRLRCIKAQWYAWLANAIIGSAAARTAVVCMRSMEHKGVEYTVRARPGPNQWIWTILRKGKAPLTAQFVGTQHDAMADACRAIDRWLERQARAAGKAY
jgi:hypothetical protein